MRKLLAGVAVVLGSIATVHADLSCYSNPTNPIAVAQQQRYNSNFVTRCFYYLDRAPSAQELAHWSGELNDCLMTNSQVQSGIMALKTSALPATTVQIVITNMSSQPLQGVVMVVPQGGSLSRFGGATIPPGGQSHGSLQVSGGQNYVVEGIAQPLQSSNFGECISRPAAVNGAFPGNVISVELDDSLPGAWSNAPRCIISTGD